MISAEGNGLDCDYAIDNISVTKVNTVFTDSFEGDALPGCLLNNDYETVEYCATSAEGLCGERGECALRPVSCADVFAPVCGCDGQTYVNACAAAQAGANVDYIGECS